MGVLRGHPGQINNAIPDKKIATETRLGGSDSDFNTHCRAQQGLVNGGADAEEKHCGVKVASLVRSVNPSQETEQNYHHTNPAEGRNSIDGNRLAPHDASEAKQQAGDSSGNHTDDVFPFAGNVPQFFDSLHEHAAAPDRKSTRLNSSHLCM